MQNIKFFQSNESQSQKKMKNLKQKKNLLLLSSPKNIKIKKYNASAAKKCKNIVTQ